MPILFQDLRYAVRQLRRRPGFALGVVFVVALGMGAGAAMLTVLRGTLLQPLPFAHPDTLVILQPHADDGRLTDMAVPDTEIWRSRSHTLQGVALFGEGSGFIDVGSGDEPISALPVSANFFNLVGQQPALGRTFTAQEQTSQAPVMLLSDTLWHTLFQGRPGVLGTVVRFNGQPRTVIGVMPAGFAFPVDASQPEAWIPLVVPASARQRDFSSGGFHALARLRPGATPAAASAELSSIQKTLRPLYTGGLASALAPVSVEATPLRDTLDASARPALQAILAAVAILWLIACASAAGLLLARSSTRTQEYAVREALGASSWRLLRQLLTESLLLAFLAALFGVVLSTGLLTLSHRVLDRQLHHPLPNATSPAVLLAMTALVVLTTVLCGTLPALLLARLPLERSLRDAGARSGSSRLKTRLQQTLIVGELALTLTLLIACGLLLRTVFSLRKIPLGFRTDHILVAELQLPAFRYDNQDLLRTIYRPLLEKAEALPGVESASLSTVMPLSGDYDMKFGMFVTSKGSSKTEESYMRLRMATPGLQKVLGFHMLKGRYFLPSDVAGSQPVAVVNQAFAQRYDRDGKHWAAGDLSYGDVHVVGITDNLRQASMLETALPEMQLPAAQLTPESSVPFKGVYQTLMQAHAELALRTALPPSVLKPQLERLLRAQDPALASSTIRTMDQIVDDSIGSQLLASRLLLAFSGTALLVALAGLYSLLSFSVSTRTRELGVRLALGAQRSDVSLLVLRGAALLLLVGTALGATVSAATVHLLKAFLFGVQTTDLSTSIAAVCLLLLCGSLAAWIPARRAAATDPMHALRIE